MAWQNQLMMPDSIRCAWALNDPNREYHDQEWGVPVHDDRLLFEMLTLEGAQAGLSWTTVLKRREGYRRAFDGFDVGQISRYGDEKRTMLLTDPGIIRNRAKVDSTISNARHFLEVQETHGSFATFLWRFVDGRPVVNGWKDHTEVPATTPLSDRLSKELARLGFRFVGTTICYAYMQAVGLVNDHTVDCFRYSDLA